MSNPQEPFIVFEINNGNWSYLVPDGKGGFRENGRFETLESAKYSAGKARQVFEAAQSGAGTITFQDNVQVF